MPGKYDNLPPEIKELMEEADQEIQKFKKEAEELPAFLDKERQEAVRRITDTVNEGRKKLEESIARGLGIEVEEKEE